jgi:hypothetical protein
LGDASGNDVPTNNFVKDEPAIQDSDSVYRAASPCLAEARSHAAWADTSVLK